MTSSQLHTTKHQHTEASFISNKDLPFQYVLTFVASYWLMTKKNSIWSKCVLVTVVGTKTTHHKATNWNTSPLLVKGRVCLVWFCFCHTRYLLWSFVWDHHSVTVMSRKVIKRPKNADSAPPSYRPDPRVPRIKLTAAPWWVGRLQVKATVTHRSFATVQ